MMVAALPGVKRVDGQARHLARLISSDPTLRRLSGTWIRYDDLRLLQRTVRQEAYFDAGWRLGFIAGAAAAPARGVPTVGLRGGSRATATAVRSFRSGVTRLVTTTPLQREQVAAVLLEVARAVLLNPG